MVIAGEAIATAAGCQLVASCDLAYAVKSAAFATPGVNIGLFCSTPMVALSRNTNKHSMEMLLTENMISSNKAVEIGLINRMINDEELKNFVLEKALEISKKSSLILQPEKKHFIIKLILIYQRPMIMLQMLWLKICLS